MNTQTRDNETSAATGYYLVRYPSGKTFTVRGQFALTPLDDWLVPTVFQDDNKASVLDQRAIVKQAGREVYSPRRNLDGLQPAMTQWLSAHPEWGR